MNRRFQLPERTEEQSAAFDLVRASVNLMVASILIAIASSLKLPLSTTYVSFMVAMGASLADRAWGAESAFYRVAGVMNVIGGWFLTALSALLVSGSMAFVFYRWGIPAITTLFGLAALLFIRSQLRFAEEKTSLKRSFDLLLCLIECVKDPFPIRFG